MVAVVMIIMMMVVVVVAGNSKNAKYLSISIGRISKKP
jgi:hypothetical protein